MNIIFMGTPAFAVPALLCILESGLHNVVGVYTQPPKQAGRGMQLKNSVIHEVAERHNLPVFTPKSLRNVEEQQRFASLKADIAVVAAYGLLLPEEILIAPKYGCLNIHPSMLPRWRGAAPLQRTIMAGDCETAVCIMQMDEGLDTGDVILCEKFQLSPSITCGELHDITAKKGADLMMQAISQFSLGTVQRIKQSEEGVTYATKIDKREAKIDFTDSARKVLAQIHGLSPFPAAYLELNGERIKILSAEIVDLKNTAPSAVGVMLENGDIPCSEQAIRPLIMQREGKKAMPAAEVIRGLKICRAIK